MHMEVNVTTLQKRNKTAAPETLHTVRLCLDASGALLPLKSTQSKTEAISEKHSKRSITNPACSASEGPPLRYFLESMNHARETDSEREHVHRNTL